jgi:hypothetical protein
MKFHGNPSSGSRVVSCGQMDGQTYVTKLTVDFRNFANVAKRSGILRLPIMASHKQAYITVLNLYL